jgi:hypothetical protein
VGVLVSIVPESRGKQRLIQIEDTEAQDRRITLTWDQLQTLAGDVNSILRDAAEKTLTRIDAATLEKQRLEAAETAVRTRVAGLLELLDRGQPHLALQRAGEVVRDLVDLVALKHHLGVSGS